MDIERIESFIQPSMLSNTIIEIRFKDRSPATGLFIRTSDDEELHKISNTYFFF